jgi:hypothetical protein
MSSYENPTPPASQFFDIAPGNDSTGLPGSGGKGVTDPSLPNDSAFGSPVPANTGVRPSSATPGPRGDDNGDVTATDPFGLLSGSSHPNATKSGSTGTTFANGGMAGFLGYQDTSILDFGFQPCDLRKLNPVRNPANLHP